MGCCASSSDKHVAAPAASGPYMIVDMENKAGPKREGKTETPGLIPVNEDCGDAPKYWERVTKDRKAPEGSPPVLVVLYGPPGSGKSRTLTALDEKLGWSKADYVHLDPDELRYYSKDYRQSLSGVHAAELPEVKSEYGDKVVLKVWKSPDGQFTENGFAVDGKFLALSNATVRSQLIVRKAMLWPHKVEEVTDAFIDKAFVAGYNVVYDTPGNEPNKFCKALIGRARRHHPYKVVVCGNYASWEQVKERAARRAEQEGRYLAEGFMESEYRKIFPTDSLCTTHYDKFEEELQPGDERYLFDNSGSEPTLSRHDVVEASG